MAGLVSEYELEALPELEATHEAGAHPELESGRFFNALAALTRRSAGLPTNASLQRRLALAAARQAANRGLLAVRGRSRWSRPSEADVKSSSWMDPSVAPRDPCYDQTTGEPKSPWECPMSASEGELNPIRRIYPDAMMEHLGHAAAETHSEAEAEALAGAMVPLAARLVPRAALALTRATPGLACGLAGVVRTLHRSPSTRPLVRTVPAIVRNTAINIAQQASRGAPVTPQSAVRILARQTARILGSPREATQVFRRSQHLDRQFHRANRTAVTSCPNCGAALR